MAQPRFCLDERGSDYFAEAVILQPPAAQQPPCSDLAAAFAVTLSAAGLSAQQLAPCLQQAEPNLQQSFLLAALLATLRDVTLADAAACAAPSLQQAAPLVQHAAPSVQQAAWSAEQPAFAEQAAPSAQHAAPSLQQAAPSAQHPAPAFVHAV
jgi:hypothetical protein